MHAVMQRDEFARRERTNFVATQIDEIIDAAANAQTVTVEVVHHKTLRSAESGMVPFAKKCGEQMRRRDIGEPGTENEHPRHAVF